MTTFLFINSTVFINKSSAKPLNLVFKVKIRLKNQIIYNKFFLPLKKIENFFNDFHLPFSILCSIIRFFLSF